MDAVGDHCEKNSPIRGTKALKTVRKEKPNSTKLLRLQSWTKNKKKEKEV